MTATQRAYVIIIGTALIFVIGWLALCATNGLPWYRDLVLTAVLVICLAAITRLRWR